MISKDKWQKYIQKLAAIDERAGELMRQYINTHGLQDNNALIEYAYALATKYGEASSELACEMYDLMAEAQGAIVPAAVPAETATMEEVAKGMMYGKYHSPSQIPSIVSRQVRQAGADTMIQNAIRDRAEWAWVPSGDTCAFCITLASRGWQTASKKVLKGNHAEHIHQNCDCTFAIVFNSKGKKMYDAVYDPDKYADMYYGADGRTPTDKINAIRRAKYQQNKDYINAQKRDVYQARKADVPSRFLKSYGQSGSDNGGSGNNREIESVGHFDENISALLRESFGSLLTDEVVLTRKQLDHIANKHPEDYQFLRKYLKNIVEEPDMVLKDENDYGMALFIRSYEKIQLNVSVRLVLEGDNPNYKNSVLSFYRLGDKGLKKKLKKCSVVYKKV